ncbi:Hormone-sensitive lipase [Neolecta irregularis DAH-3]|uniref:Hormone-sensitive lipase n=1 Tax=Neolecta irregularis (strain DAH-3) TaxID=1198029 RepID=A0A1U7LQR0_NEOID|nr:Hormone-sensitive lipase [Neolecta irregularis DAH-3]|eukprot:OLL25010.1 Hormone-sensitive lipase [Neolecta irregularis DAH-3]
MLNLYQFTHRTAEQLRVSLAKVSSPYLKFFVGLSKPRLKIKRKIVIPRNSAEPSEVWIYFNGSEEELKFQRKLVFFIHGGGFISTNPECYEEVTFAWASELNVPVVAINYKKAPEYPFPYALYECRDLYLEIVKTNGAIIGFEHSQPLTIAFAGDSAGGNLATSLIILLLTEHLDIPIPAGLVLVYPALDLNLTCWMTNENMCLLRQESVRDVSDAVIDSKLNYEKRKSVLQPYSDNYSPRKSLVKIFQTPPPKEAEKCFSPTPRMKNARTKLAMTSRVSFFQDRILSPEMLRAMVLLYVGPQNRPNFETDYLLCPLRAPTEVLAKFPKTYLLCGEKDAMVDDTVLLAGRIREAKRAALNRRQNLQMTSLSSSENDWIEIVLLRGVSHGFFQMAFILPEAKKAISKCRGWLKEILDDQSFISPSFEDDDEPVEMKSSNSLLFPMGPTLPISAMIPQNKEGHDTWERFVMQESDLLNRRREGVMRGLQFTES